jgi:hypothetical protein
MSDRNLPALTPQLPEVGAQVVPRTWEISCLKLSALSPAERRLFLEIAVAAAEDLHGEPYRWTTMINQMTMVLHPCASS